MKATLKSVAVAAALGLSALALAGPAQAVTRPPASSTPDIASLRAAVRNGTLSASTGTYDICAANHLACNAEVKTIAPGSRTLLATNQPAGFGATDLAKAYGLTAAAAGSGTVAIIDAGAYPSLASDLATYRAQYGLPACTTASGCLTIENFKGAKAYAPQKSAAGKEAEEEVAVETSLDMDLASAACPACKLIELQVPWKDALLGTTAQTHAAEQHFSTAVATAHRLGATAVSISYGYPVDSFSNTGAPAKRMKITGLAVTSSSGDGGFEGSASQWPQDLPTVISVGGTSLHVSGTTYNETAWSDAGSSCTPGLPAANGQPASVTVNCHGARTSTDISADADPNTGPAIYDTYAPASGNPPMWDVVGGTSASSPFIAGLYARAGVGSTVLGPNAIYAAPASAFRDVTSGQNASASSCTADSIGVPVCVAGTGWDGPTGRGTPQGLTPFQ